MCGICMLVTWHEGARQAAFSSSDSLSCSWKFVWKSRKLARSKQPQLPAWPAHYASSAATLQCTVRLVCRKRGRGRGGGREREREIRNMMFLEKQSFHWICCPTSWENLHAWSWPQRTDLLLSLKHVAWMTCPAFSHFKFHEHNIIILAWYKVCKVEYFPPMQLRTRHDI